MHELSKEVKITKCAAGAEAATTAVNGSVLDMAGFEGVMFLASFGTANAGNYMKAQQGAVSNLSDAADLEDTKVTSGTSDECVALDVYKPQKRYVRPVLVRGASSTTGIIWAIQYGSRVAPRVSALSGTLAIETHVSPDEGTA